jgi:hypothetical protein
MDAIYNKKPAFLRAYECYWILLDVDMVEPGGIEPPTFALRTRRSPG